jgi:streptogramin lyase
MPAGGPAGAVSLVARAAVPHALPAGSQAAAALAPGPRNALWYVDANAQGVGAATAGSKTATFYPTLGGKYGSPTASCQVAGNSAGIWFASPGGAIVAIGGGGKPRAQYTIRSKGGKNAVPACLAAGSNGALWFTASHSTVGYVSRAGTVTALTGIGTPSSIAALPGGNAFYCNADTLSHDVVVQLATTGTVKIYAVPARLDFCTAIVAGPDGNLWIADAVGAVVARLTPQGKFTLYSLRAAFKGNVAIAGLVAASDGHLWEAGSNSNGVTLARISTSGAVTAFHFGQLSAPTSMAALPGGPIWLNAPNAAKIYSVKVGN